VGLPPYSGTASHATTPLLTFGFGKTDILPAPAQSMPFFNYTIDFQAAFKTFSSISLKLRNNNIFLAGCEFPLPPAKVDNLIFSLILSGIICYGVISRHVSWGRRGSAGPVFSS
jgi:hypothetical protein